MHIRIVWSGLLLLVLLGVALPVHAQLEPFGLQGTRVNALAAVPEGISLWMPLLCAGTESDGVLICDLSSGEPDWEPLGLESHEILAVDIHHWGVGPSDFNTVFAAVMPEYAGGDSTLVYSFTYTHTTPDTGWVDADSGLAHDAGITIRSLGSMYYSGQMTPRPVFAGSSGGTIYRALLYPFWESVWGQGGSSVTNVIETRQWPPYDDGVVWAGGEGGFFQPYLTKSTDDGLTWETFFPDLGGDNACNSIAIHPDDPNVVYAGMEGAVIRTVNGGDDWETTGLHSTPYYFYGLVMNPWSPEHLLAGGTPWHNEFALYETLDGGETWTLIDPGTDLPGVSDMVSDTTGGVFAVYLSTWGDGVYRYQTPASDIPEGQLTARLWSRGIVGGSEPSSRLEYWLPAMGVAEVRVHDLLGREIEAIVLGRQLAGRHSVTWVPDGTSSGVRFCTLYLNGQRLDSARLVCVR